MAAIDKGSAFVSCDIFSKYSIDCELSLYVIGLTSCLGDTGAERHISGFLGTESPNIDPLIEVLGLDLHDVILLLCELDRQDISSSNIPSSELALLDVSPEPGITKSGIVLGVSPPRKSAHF
jgi:hypothetical protein